MAKKRLRQIRLRGLIFYYQKEQRSRVLESYNIISIPEILLIDPEGNILAKGLRGERIYETVKMYLK